MEAPKDGTSSKRLKLMIPGLVVVRLAFSAVVLERAKLSFPKKWLKIGGRSTGYTLLGWMHQRWDPRDVEGCLHESIYCSWRRRRGGAGRYLECRVCVVSPWERRGKEEVRGTIAAASLEIFMLTFGGARPFPSHRATKCNRHSASCVPSSAQRMARALFP